MRSLHRRRPQILPLLVLSVAGATGAHDLAAQEATGTATSVPPAAEVAAPVTEGSDGAPEPMRPDPVPTARLLPSFKAGETLTRTIAVRRSLEVRSRAGGRDVSTHWDENASARLRITMVAGSRRAPRSYGVLVEHVEGAASMLGRLRTGDALTCEAFDRTTCSDAQGQPVEIPAWLWVEWSGWWSDGRPTADGSWTRARDASSLFWLSPGIRGRGVFRPMESRRTPTGASEVEFRISGDVAQLLHEDITAIGTLTGIGRAEVIPAEGRASLVSFSWEARSEIDLPGAGSATRIESVHTRIEDSAPEGG
jgi:hypothetical protein